MREVQSDLLLGVFAVQLGLASARQVMVSAAAWAADRSAGLADRLVADGHLSDGHRSMLEAMVSEAAARHGGDLRATLHTFGGDRAVLASFGGAVSSASGEGRRADAPLATEDEELVTPEHPGRYRLGPAFEPTRTGGRESAELARGAKGPIQVATDHPDRREVAIKELLSDPRDAQSGSPDAGPGHTAARVSRFLREARLTGQLEHPNIVPVYEVGRRDDGTLYYAMKLVRGRTLAEALDDCVSLSQRLGLLGHFADICQAVAYAHSRGVIHRDIKPSNVMVGEFGETVLLDWGLAKVRGTDVIGGDVPARSPCSAPDPGMTVAGEAIGTPAYMSPEQAEGRLEDIDERSDVWGLGAVLYELLTGRPPFEGLMPFEVVGQVIRGEVAPPRSVEPDVPTDLALLCAKCLARDPAERVASAAELARQLDVYSRSEMEARARGLETILKTYLSPSVVEKLLGQQTPHEVRVEEKELTVLFSDIIGFTSLVEADVTTVFRHVLGPYVQLVAEAVERWGGNLDKFLADEAMVVFGDPRPVPDHAERAIQCALEIQEGFERLLRGDELRGLPPSGLRQGIHTGPMWAGSFGSRRRMEYSVLGDNVNIGARLCTNAPAEGGITISEATRRATERGCAGEAELPAGRGYRLLPREAVALKAPAGRTADFYGAEGRKVEAWDVEREEPNR